MSFYSYNKLIRHKNHSRFLPFIIAAAVPATGLAQDSAASDDSLSPMVVSATRSETPASQLTRSVTVVTEEEIQQQASLDQDLGSILAQTVPGMSPSTEALSNFGQSLRGRNFLVLIDGIPQSTPLRDGFRDLNTINPAAIERIEVVRGGTAVYGFGAAGGLVNIITKKPSDEELAGHSEAGMSFSTEHVDSSAEYTTSHRVSGTRGQIDYLASGIFTNRDDRFDSEGRRIPPDPMGVQGGIADTDEYNLLGKFGYDFDNDRQRVDVMLNHYNIEQDTNFIFGSVSSLGTDPLPNSRRTPAVPVSSAIPGSTNIRNPGTENTATNINYSHDDLLGSRVKLTGYYGDQTAVFAKFPGFPQSEIASEKIGSRLTIDTPLAVQGLQASVIWGMDYVHDETSQETFGPTATASPLDLEQDAVAGFAELEIPVSDIGLVRGGVRHEEISVDVATVPLNRFGNTVQGGTLDFSETLFNASGVLYLTDSEELFASFSQGFSLSDLGRVIDDAGPFGAGQTFQAEQFETDAEKVDNYEVGIRSNRGSLNFTLAAFYSESDNGTTFDQNLVIQKFSEEVWGIEAALDYRFNRQWQAGGTFSWSEGERNSATGMTADLDNTRISPEKLTAYVEYDPRTWWQNRLQVQYVGSRDPDTGSNVGFGNGDVDSYTLVDLISRFAVGPGHLSVSVENLLNRDYFPAINQAFNMPFSFAKGPGRRVGLSYSVKW